MITHELIYDIVKKIPKGKVATYGQIAKLIGYPNHARQIGHALSKLNADSEIPWHRVINACGKISPRGLNGCDDYQRLLLEEENIKFNKKDTISISDYLWEPNK